MTKYILNSGGSKNSKDKGRAFYREMVKNLGDSPKVLYCFFAQPREDWEAKYTEYTASFLSHMSENIKPIFELAFPETFEQQVKVSDVINIPGGDDHLVQYWLKKYDLPKIWEGKVVAASSAGSNALASSFWTCDWRQCMNGLGILPVKFLPHFMSQYGATDPRGPIDWNTAKEELAQFGDTKLPIYASREGNFEVFEEQE